MRSFPCTPEFPDRLLKRLSEDHTVVGPIRGDDGVGRLRPVRRWRDVEPGTLPLIPAKRFLLPSRDPLWTLSGEEAFCRPQEPLPPTALIGLPPCDLYGLAYLDAVFDEDTAYQARRERLFLAGSSCTPGPDCFCPPRNEPPPFDLFLDGERVWAGSERGAEVLRDLVDQGGEADLRLPESLTDGRAPGVPEDLEARFAGSGDRPLWREVGERCLSCGACSAVCPTCYCYDVIDEALPDGSVTRLREWDNCFFRNHGLVAGGHNFRPSRTERLRFRFEHKMLGFGDLRGVSSCVGCGRCGRACPVDIDIADVLDRLLERGVP